MSGCEGLFKILRNRTRNAGYAGVKFDAYKHDILFNNSLSCKRVYATLFQHNAIKQNSSQSDQTKHDGYEACSSPSK